MQVVFSLWVFVVKKIIKGTIISFNGKCMSSQASLALNSILNYSNSSSSNSSYEERRKCYDNHHIFHLLCLLGNFRVEFIKNIYMNEFCTQNITKITPSAFDLIELLCVLKQSNIFCNHDHLKFINKQHTNILCFHCHPRFPVITMFCWCFRLTPDSRLPRPLRGTCVWL